MPKIFSLWLLAVLTVTPIFGECPALLGKSKTGRDQLVEHDGFRTFGYRDGLWKYIPPMATRRSVYARHGSLYDLSRDPGETNNLITAQPDTVKKLSVELNSERHATNLVSGESEPRQ